MDTAINSGDFVCDANGHLIELSGYDELLQRVLIRLNIKQGSFVYDNSLGSRLYTLKPTDANIKNRALAMVREALADITEVVVEDVSGNGSQTDAGWCEGWKAVEQTGLCAGMTKACPIEVPATDINRRKGKTVILQPLTISTTAFGVAKIDTSVE